MKTIKQIADEIGIDKQRVYRFIKRSHISEAHQSDSVMWYDEAAETLIISHFLKSQTSCEAHHDVHQTVSSDTVSEALFKLVQCELETLREELKIKNKQIEELTATVRIQAESISADRKNDLAGTLIDGQQKLLDGAAAPTGADDVPEQKKKRGFMSWFRKSG